MAGSDRLQDRDALLRRAYGPGGPGLTSEEAKRLALMLDPRSKIVERAEGDGAEKPHTDGDPEGPRRKNLRGAVAAGLLGVIAGIGIGLVVNVSAPDRSPYLTNAEVRTHLPDYVSSEDVGGVDMEPPDDENADPHSMILNAVIEGNPAWTWTQNDGSTICYQIDLTEEVELGGCATRSFPLTSIAQRSNHPMLTEPADLGTYTVTAFEDALPFVSYEEQK